MEIGDVGVEQETTLHDDLQFIESQDVPAGDSATYAYEIEGPEGFVIFVEGGTEFAPDFRDANGNPLDGSTRVELVKCDKQGNRLGDGIVLTDLLSKYNYDKMRNDPDFFRHTKKDLMIDEREIARIYVHVPEGANGFSAEQSNLTIGDDTSDFGTPVEIVDHDDLTTEETAAVKAASQAGGQ